MSVWHLLKLKLDHAVSRSVIYICTHFINGFLILAVLLITDRPHFSGVIDISPRQSLGQVIAVLKEDKKTLATDVLKIIFVLAGKDHHMQAGEYTVDPQQPLLQVFWDIAAGRVVQYPFNLIEGRTVQGVFADLKLTHDLELDVNLSDLHEGELLPDTYFFVKGAAAKGVIARARKAMDDYVDRLWSQRSQNLLWDTKQQTLIIASLLEKESALPDERFLIAKVIENRLRKGMRLQIDATVLYGQAHSDVVTYKMLNVKHPYNTYRYHGLPPTPICMPSRQAIYAALHPTGSDDILYYVLQEDGSHYFSKTLDEHREAKARRKE